MNIQIKHLSWTVAVGSGDGDFHVPHGVEQRFDVGDSFGVPDNWVVHSAWYQVTDAISDWVKFRGVDVAIAGNDVWLILRGGQENALTRITVFALYILPS